jgi:hypothetical protein
MEVELIAAIMHNYIKMKVPDIGTYTRCTALLEQAHTASILVLVDTNWRKLFQHLMPQWSTQVATTKEKEFDMSCRDTKLEHVKMWGAAPGAVVSPGGCDANNAQWCTAPHLAKSPIGTKSTRTVAWDAWRRNKRCYPYKRT